MKRRNLLYRFAAGLATQVAFPALGQSEKRILLGQSAAMSGPAAQLGLQMNAGARLYFERVNAEGGIGGRKIELLALDDGYEPERCRANTERLIVEKDVFALFGYVGTPTSLAALPLVNTARVPFFGPFTGAEALREPFSHQVFHVRASYFDETARIVNELTGLGLTRIAVFRQNDSYGQAGLDGVTRALAARKLAPVAVGGVERNSVDVAAAIKAIVPLQPHAIVQISAYKSCAAFIRAARDAGCASLFYNVSFVGTQALADELGAQALGVAVTQVMPFPYGTTTAIAREYRDALHHAGGSARPDYSSIEGYVAAKVFCEGLRHAGANPTRESLVAGLEAMGHYDLGGFSVNFSARDHRGSSFVDLSMLTGDGKVRV